MKNPLFFVLTLLALALNACGPKPEEVCDCIRQSANNFMLQGTRPSEAKLLAPCAEMMAKLKDDGAAKVRIEADYEDVKKALEAKKLLAVDGKTPEFAPLTAVYDSVLLDYARDYDVAQYRYKNRAVTATVTCLLGEVDSTESGFVANCTPLYRQPNGEKIPTNTRICIPVSAALRPQLAAASNEALFDRKKRRSLEEDDRWFENGYLAAGTYFGTHIDGGPVRTGRSAAFWLKEYLKKGSPDIFRELQQEHDANAEQYSEMEAEVRAGNYVLFDEKNKISNYFYFNKLTAKGELTLDGKNGHGLPLFTLKNAAVIKNEDLLPGLLAR